MGEHPGTLLCLPAFAEAADLSFQWTSALRYLASTFYCSVCFEEKNEHFDASQHPQQKGSLALPSSTGHLPGWVRTTASSSFSAGTMGPGGLREAQQGRH